MKKRSGLGFACVAAGFAVAAPCVSDARAAAGPDGASPGYAEVPAPSQSGSIAIVPRPEPQHLARSYAIVTVPDHAASASRQAVVRSAAPVLASLPAGPPLTVDIRFDPRRADNAARASQIASALARGGIAVQAIGPVTVSISDGVGFVFAEDEAAADAVARQLSGSLAHTTQLRPDAAHAVAAAPGTIEIMLGNDKGTS